MKHTPFPQSGLYVITDERLVDDDAALRLAVQQAIEGGARVVQFRDKSREHDRRLRQATDLARICRAARVPLIVNDDVELAARSGADGVHVGADDAGAEQARQRLGQDAIVGVSCYGSLAHAEHALRAGADYVAFGSFFRSPTKPQAGTASPLLLAQARTSLACPVVAIGGITADNGASLIAAGADLLAVVSAVFARPEGPRAAAERLAALFPTESD